MIGDYRHRVVFQNPGPAQPDGDGGYTQTWADVPPGAWFTSVAPAAPNDLERFTAGTVITQLAHIVRGRYLAAVTTATRMLFDARTFAIAGTRNVDERSVSMELLAIELSGPPLASLLPTLPYTQQVRADGASHYWRLDEPAGTIAADQVGYAHGTISGGVTLGHPGALGDGNPAMAFAATGRIGTAPVVALPVPSSVEAWLQLPPVVTAAYGAICSCRGAANGFMLATFVRDVGCYADAATPPQVSPGITLASGIWYHVVLVRSTASALLLYINGSPYALSQTQAAVTAAPIVMSDPGNGNAFDGVLDEIAIYPHALTADQIAAHYAARTLL